MGRISLDFTVSLLVKIVSTVLGFFMSWYVYTYLTIKVMSWIGYSFPVVSLNQYIIAFSCVNILTLGIIKFLVPSISKGSKVKDVIGNVLAGLVLSAVASFYAYNYISVATLANYGIIFPQLGPMAFAFYSLYFVIILAIFGLVFLVSIKAFSSLTK